jgi:hypothetical protein
VLDGQVLDHLPGQRHRHPLRPGRPAGRLGHWSPPSGHRRSRCRPSRTGGTQPTPGTSRRRAGSGRSRRPGTAHRSATR